MSPKPAIIDLSSENNLSPEIRVKSENISLKKKIFIYPISKWQRVSYNSKIFNCQFYPSCSNFGANSIKKYGGLFGTIIAADRIVRCNPSALHYHSKIDGAYNDKDGRLIDFVDPKNYF